MSDQTSYWTNYYEKLVEDPKPWLDYSNERVQAQSLALALEAGGAPLDKQCLDVGCGNGQLALCLKQLGAAKVTAIDTSSTMIATNRGRHPEIDWQVSTADEAHLRQKYDLIYFVEVLQYLPLVSTMEKHWAALNPGGRLVAIVPNRDCPIVEKAIARFAGHYAPPRFNEIKTMFGTLRDVAHGAIRGFTFQAIQAIAPYEISAWTQGEWTAAPPNRWQFVAVKK